jgi:hypothetical protein
MLEHKHLIVRAKLEKPPADIDRVNTWVEQLGDGALTSSATSEGMYSVLVGETSMVAARFWNPGLLQLDVCASEINPTDVFDHIEEFVILTKSHLFLDRTNTIQQQQIY